MIVFGLVSSVFDYLTFGVLLWLNATSPVPHRMVHGIDRLRIDDRSGGAEPSAVFQKQAKQTTSACHGVVVVPRSTPYLPFAGRLGFQPMPAHFYPIIALIIFAYIATAEATKVRFYRKIGKV